MHDSWTLQDLPLSASRERSKLLEEAQRYLDGHHDLLNMQFQRAVPDWHLDVETGIRSPTSFALDIDYRDFKVAGNIKNIWELNRHRHITVLSAAYALTGDKRYEREAERQFLSWLEQNPFPCGVNWHSSLELGVRLIAWVWCERLLRGSDSHNRLYGTGGALWDAIYWHQWLIAKNPSSGSSANNHLLGEMAGLFTASVVWPYFPESLRWEATSRRILEHEITRQTFPSGLNRELAFSYHRFSLELFLLADIEGERAGKPLTPAYRSGVKRMIEVIPKVVDVGGNLPRYGDEDGGTALQLRPQQSSWIDWVYRLGIQWTQAQVPVPRDGSGILAAGLILPFVEHEPSQPTPPIKYSVGFDDAGVYVLVANRDTPREMFCLADVGPLGFLSIAAHGHADALSFTLSIGGRRIVVDPGTYSYFCDPSWRFYFRSTKAHNTVVVDGADQSTMGGPFLWTQKATSRLIRWNPGTNCTELVGEHDGYARLGGRVTHRRRLQLIVDRLDIYDDILGTGTHDLEWRLHFSPDCSVDLDTKCCRVHWDKGEARISLASHLQWRVARGTSDGGWYSPAFNCKVVTSTLIGSLTTQLPTALQHSIELIRSGG